MLEGRRQRRLARRCIRPRLCQLGLRVVEGHRQVGLLRRGLGLERLEVRTCRFDCGVEFALARPPLSLDSLARLVPLGPLDLRVLERRSRRIEVGRRVIQRSGQRGLTSVRVVSLGLCPREL